MKNRIMEIIRIVCMFSKKTNWLSIFCFSALWSTGAFRLCVSYLNAGLKESLRILFSPNAISLLHAIVYALSFGLPIMFTIVFLQHPLCEEFYYSRIRKRSSVAYAKILCVSGITGASVFTMVFTSSILHFIEFRDSGIFIGLPYVCSEIASLLVPRIGLAIFFILSEQLNWNLILEFTALTGMIVGCVFLPAGQEFLKNDKTWIGAVGLTVIFFFLCLYIDAKHDISIGKGDEKNDG